MHVYIIHSMHEGSRPFPSLLACVLLLHCVVREEPDWSAVVVCPHLDILLVISYLQSLFLVQSQVGTGGREQNAREQGSCSRLQKLKDFCKSTTDPKSQQWATQIIGSAKAAIGGTHGLRSHALFVLDRIMVIPRSRATVGMLHLL